MSALVGSIAGTATGILGSLLSSGFNYLTARQNNKHEIALIEAKTKERVAESKAKIQEIQIEGVIKQELAAQESFNLSQQYGNKNLIESPMILKLFDSKWTWLLGAVLVFFMAVVDVVRSAMRPAITITLMLITGIITYQHLQILSESQELVTAETIFMIIDSINYLTFTVISWWFGLRTNEKIFNRRK